MPQEMTITRVAITTEADAEKKGTEMGRKHIIPYGFSVVRVTYLQILHEKQRDFPRTTYRFCGKPFSTCLSMTIPRQEVRMALEKMHQLYKRAYTPKVKPTKACRVCSLYELCLPALMIKRSVKEYMEERL